MRRNRAAQTVQTIANRFARRAFSDSALSGTALQDVLREVGKSDTSDLTYLCDLVNRCRVDQLRAFSELCDVARKIDCRALPVADLITLLRNYSTLGCLYAPLFMDAAPIARATTLQPEDMVSLAESYATQRVRDVDLFDSWRSNLDALSPADQVRMRHAYASLRIPCALQPRVDKLSLKYQAQLAESVLLENQDLNQLLEILASLELDESTLMSRATHRRLLLLRSGLRYLYRESYAALPTEQRNVLRTVHHREMDPPMLKCTKFVDTLCYTLTKLKIAHQPRVLRGPFIFDVLERDRKLVYEANHKDRFYALSFDKIASRQLQEKIVKAMGYRVVQVPHWHWEKLCLRRIRREYIRMSRYYAIKDRREYSLRDEEFLGEYFFRKDRPIQPFAWAKHKEQLREVREPRLAD